MEAGGVLWVDVMSGGLLNLDINAVFPHQVARIARSMGARFVTFSTDCVFSGTKGNYAEADSPDASDVYGKTKLLGELHYPHTLTLLADLVFLELGNVMAYIVD